MKHIDETDMPYSLRLSLRTRNHMD